MCATLPSLHAATVQQQLRAAAIHARAQLFVLTQCEVCLPILPQWQARFFSRSDESGTGDSLKMAGTPTLLAGSRCASCPQGRRRAGG